jgi:hypothetical protein
MLEHPAAQPKTKHQYGQALEFIMYYPLKVFKPFLNESEHLEAFDCGKNQFIADNDLIRAPGDSIDCQ